MVLRRTAIALILASALAARAQAPAMPSSAAPAVPPAPATPPAPPGQEPARWKGFSADAGWGYYEAAHVGASYHFDERAALGLFGGYGIAEAQTFTVGLSFSHALFGRFWTIQPGWDAKAIYWARSDANYDWKNATFVLGGNLGRDLGDRLRLTLDAGVALTAALQSNRKQDFNFGHPERWNASVCLDVSYRLGRP